MHARIIVVALIIFLIEIYFFQVVKTLTAKYSPLAQKKIRYAYWSFTVFIVLYSLTAVIIPLKDWPNVIRIYVTSFIFVVSFSKLFACFALIVDDLARLLKLTKTAINNLTIKQHGSEKTNGTKISRSKFLNQIALGTSSFFFLNFIWGMLKTAFNIQIRQQVITIPNLPESFKGLRIVQFSDIHLGSFISKQPVQNAVKLINDLNPDVIFFTGDLVNEQTDEAFPFIDTLKELKAQIGIFSILGNHDYGDYIKWPNEETKAQNLINMYQTHAKLGWNLLLNQNYIIENGKDKLAIIGIENWGAFGRFTKYGKLNEAVVGTENIDTKILLSHDPSHWSEQVTTEYKDISLTLSGHTHGMQFGIEIPGFKWSPSKYFYPNWAGLYSKGNQQLYVNRGLGFIGYAGRVGIKPEITLIELG